MRERTGVGADMPGIILRVLAAFAIVSLTSAAVAQQRPAASAAQPPQAASQPSALPAQPASPQAPATPDAGAADTRAAPGDNAGRLPKASAPTPHETPHELSPWSMFLAADVIVKAVMLGLAFASLATWTIFIAKTIELSVARRRLRTALAEAGDARSLAEAQFALGAKGDVLSSLLSAALREARLSAGISSDTGIKERAASSFAEIARAEARRIRLGMGLLATIGATAPFIGLFGTVWGIMNSFIGISRAQTTNLAVVAPGIAEALLATAIGLVAAIPAVIIYNHFARVTKTHLELVSRASGAAARLLSRDLDCGHGGPLARAAE
jgi:biopolymer transport protein ExbB